LLIKQLIVFPTINYPIIFNNNNKLLVQNRNAVKLLSLETLIAYHSFDFYKRIEIEYQYRNYI